MGSVSFNEALDFSRASEATYVGADGLIKTAGVDEHRLTHDPVTGEAKGLLIEESRTNLPLWSEAFDNAAWNKARVTVPVDAATAPDGLVAADKLVEDTTASSTHAVIQTVGVFSAGVTYTGSVFLKAGERSYAALQLGPSSNFSESGRVTFDLIDGLVTNMQAGALDAQITSLGDAWFLCSVTQTADVGGYTGNLTVFNAVSGDDGVTYTGDGTSGIYIWGAQIEQFSTPSSYIPTTDAAVTRAADNVSRVLGEEFNNNAFTVFSEFYFDASRISNNPYHPNFSGTGNGRVSLRFGGGGGASYQLQIVDNDGTVILNESVSGLNDNSINRVALSCSEPSGAIVAVNGVTSTFSIAGLPELTTMTVGDQNGAGRTNTEFLGERLYPRALSAAELVELTS